jgi:hypothetical protein
MKLMPESEGEKKYSPPRDTTKSAKVVSRNIYKASKPLIPRGITTSWTGSDWSRSKTSGSRPEMFFGPPPRVPIIGSTPMVLRGAIEYPETYTTVKPTDRPFRKGNYRDKNDQTHDGERGHEIN